MASRGDSGRGLQVSTDMGNTSAAAAAAAAAAAGVTVVATSPTSSQGSWVVDPDEGWDGLREPHPFSNSPEVPRHQHQHHQLSATSPSASLRTWAQVPVSPPAAEYPRTMTMSRSPPSSPGSVRSVASASSGGSRSSRVSSSTSVGGGGVGLVALARAEDSDDPMHLPIHDINDMDISNTAPPAAVEAGPAVVGTERSHPRLPAARGAGVVPRSPPFETFEALEARGFEGAWAEAPGDAVGPAVGLGCTKVDDVNAMGSNMDMDMDVVDAGDIAQAGVGERAFVVRAAPGMTAAEAVEAIAEAAELRGVTPASVVFSPSRTAVSPSLSPAPSHSYSPSHVPSGYTSPSPSLSEEGVGNERRGGGEKSFGRFHHDRSHSPPSPAGAGAAGATGAASFRSMTSPPGRAPRTPSGAVGAARTAAIGVGFVPDVPHVPRVPHKEAEAVPPESVGACIPMDTAVGIEVDADRNREGDGDEKCDGKQMDRLWRWTGFITAAKMGVIPIIVCATVAALSTQSGGGSSGDRTRGGGGGGGGGPRGGGGGGGTRCSSRRRPRGGGGGGGCFPDVRIDRSLYGSMPMQLCVAPSIACT